MSTLKEYQRNIKELERKLIKTEQKNTALLEKNKTLRSERKYFRRRMKELSESRDKWKVKNKDKSLTIKKLGGKERRRAKAAYHHYDLWLVGLSIALRISGQCSYRSIARILKILRLYLGLELSRTPCANTVENWVSKMGLEVLENPDIESLKGKVGLIIDESVRVGQEHLLLILVIPEHKEKQGACCYEDVRVCFIKGQKSWTGQQIANEVKILAKKHDWEVTYVLSDEDAILKKSARLLECKHIPDISHTIGTCLRKTFSKKEEYKVYIRQIGQFQSKSVNQDLSYLRPPSQRTKARFMNQQAIVDWSNNVLARFDKLSPKEASFFETLKQHRPILKQLSICLKIAKSISMLYKTKGISKATNQAALKLLRHRGMGGRRQRTKGLIKQFIQYLRTYINRYVEIAETFEGRVHGCSDVIESLFGKYKEQISKNPRMTVSLLSLELALHCQNKEHPYVIQQGLEYSSMTDLQHWKKTHSIDNQIIRREKFFKNGT